MADNKTSRWLIAATLFSPILGAFVAWRLGFFTLQDAAGWIVAVVSVIYAFLVYPVTLPLWLIVVLAAGTLVFTGVFLLLVYKEYKLAYKEYNEPKPTDYQGTEMFGVIWKWEWEWSIHADKYVIANHPPYCPKCLHVLDSEYTDRFKGSNEAVCPSCGFRKSLPVNTVEKLKGEIRKHVRTGEYVQRIKDFEKRKEEIRQKSAREASDS